MKHIYLFLLYTFVLYTHTPAKAQEVISRPFVLGSAVELTSAQLSEKRILNIYLPECYEQRDTTRYPVIYLLDGTANEDFVHVTGLVQFFTMMQMMPPAIVVGVANVDRKRDFTFPTTVVKDKQDFPTTGGSEKFMAFLAQELVPFIDRNYHTNASRTIIGQSLGGLLATEILLKKPGLFNHFIILSPSLWWDHESLLKQYLTMAGPLPSADVFIAVGEEGQVMKKDARALKQALEKQKNIKVHFRFLSGENHATILHLAVYEAFKLRGHP